MLVWASCRYVDRSGFINHQFVNADFKSFIEEFLDPKEFILADKKNALPLFIPAEFVEGNIVRRSSNNVLAVHLGVLDLDHGTVAEQQLTLDIVKQYGHCVYTSFSHDPAAQHKRRAIIKLSRPVDITEWRSFFPRMLSMFQALETADKKCADPCHMYFVPGGDINKYECYSSDGAALDVDAVLALPQPAGTAEVHPEGYVEYVPEAERGEITSWLRYVWEAKLANLAAEIEKRPYPGPLYDLKVHKVFGLARGVPHIMTADRLRGCVGAALKYRYRKAYGEDAYAVPALLEQSIKQVDQAISEGALRPWYPLKSHEVIVRRFSEFGLAERLVDLHAQDIRWEPKLKSWFGWNSKYWAGSSGHEAVQQKMFDTIRSIPNEADALAEDYVRSKELYEGTLNDPNVDDVVKAQAEFNYEGLRKQIEKIHSFALKSETKSHQTNATVIASSFPQVLAEVADFNRHPWLINFKNGTLDLGTGVFREHRREDFISRIVPYNFDPKGECPMFDMFMDSFTSGNQEMANFLWRAIGYSACGVTDEQKIFLLHGDGANGKSTFLNLLLDIFGSGPNGYGMAANSENLLSVRGSSKHETWRMSLASVRLVACQEVDEGRALAESLIKELTGSDIITGRKLYQDEWSYKPEFSLWLAVNHLPHVRGTDEGIWRRLCVIECNASFKDRPDHDMPRRLRLEAPGIWARIAREAKAWIGNRLVLPNAVVEASAMYRSEQDPLREYVERWCVVEDQAAEPRPALWAAYEEYCTENKTRTFHEQKRFYAALEKRFPIKTVRGVRFFSGLRVKTARERIDSSPRAVLQRAIQNREDEGKPN